MSVDDVGTLRWFGASWGAPVNDPRAEVAVPVGAECGRCDREIVQEDAGIRLPHYDGFQAGYLAWHLDCWFAELGMPTRHEQRLRELHHFEVEQELARIKQEP